MENPKRYTITSALPYANGPVHIGHLAGVYIPAVVAQVARVDVGREIGRASCRERVLW